MFQHAVELLRKEYTFGKWKILQDDAVMVQPIFRPVYTIAAKSVHGYPGHPTQCHQFNKVWKA